MVPKWKAKHYLYMSVSDDIAGVTGPWRVHFTADSQTPQCENERKAEKRSSRVAEMSGEVKNCPLCPQASSKDSEES